MLRLNSITHADSNTMNINFRFLDTVLWLLARRMAVNPMPLSRVIDLLSVSIKPHVVVDVVTVWDKPLKHVVDVLICDDRQCGVQASTELSRIIPTQHWIVRVETIFLIVHWVARGEGRYDICDVENEQYASYKTPTHTLFNKYISHQLEILFGHLTRMDESGEFFQQFPRVIGKGRHDVLKPLGWSQWRRISQPPYLSVEDATELALDRPLWRLLAASGATYRICESRTMMMMKI